MVEVQFKRDFKYIDWKATLQVALFRSVAAGIMFAIILGIMAIGAKPGNEAPPFYAFLLIPIGMPFLNLFYIPLGILCAFLSEKGVPYVGWVTLATLFFIVPGDPLTFFVHKYKNSWIPVKEFKFLNFTMLIWVLDLERRKAELGSAPL